MRIAGIITKVNREERIVTIKTKYRLYFIYFKRSLMSQFRLFLFEGNLMDLDVVDPIIKQKKEVYQVYYVVKIKSLVNGRIYFDRYSIEKSLGEFLTSSKYLMFLDLEKTMPPFNYKGTFNSEIIQIAFVIATKDGEEVLRYNNYVKPKDPNGLNSRTCKFLSLNINDFYRKAANHLRVYNDLKKALKRYRPSIFVYGKNDILSLQEFYKIHRLPSLMAISRFVNLSSLIAEYYHHNKEYGLFKLYELYYGPHAIQTHDAYSDALVTSKVFRAFREEVLHERYTLMEKYQNKKDS